MKRKVFSQSLGEHLIDMARGATEEVLLVAPYIKEGTLKRIFSPISGECSVRVVTCWNLRAVAAGASDLGVWELVRDRENHVLELCPSLHAKYYRFDDICVVGSANLTGAALGLTGKPNLELLMRVSPAATEEFEEELEDCVAVTESMYSRYQKLLDQYEDTHPEIVRSSDTYSVGPESVRPGKERGEVRGSGERSQDIRSRSPEWWIPKLRHPEDLYRVYAENSEHLTTATRKHGSYDLRHFDLPEGLEEGAFEVEIRWQLLQKPVVQEVDALVSESKRFGAVRDHLRTLPCAQNDGFDPTDAWQAIMRWLLYFFDDRYRRHEANYSEIFVREE